MKSSDRERLLRETLTDANIERLRADSLAAMLGAARWRRRRRTLVSAAAASVAVLLLALALTHHERSVPAPGPISTPAARSEVKIITDEQLLAHFSGRSVALVGRPGQQRLVFLDEPAKGRIAGESP